MSYFCIRYREKFRVIFYLIPSMRILFVCVGNSCRSQMAEAIARNMGHVACSAGTHPADKVSENAIITLENRGISSEGLTPKSVDNFSAEDFDWVISMGCGVSCPMMEIDEDWGLEDPVGMPLEVFEKTADEIEQRLKLLLEA